MKNRIIAVILTITLVTLTACQKGADTTPQSTVAVENAENVFASLEEVTAETETSEEKTSEENVQESSEVETSESQSTVAEETETVQSTSEEDVDFVFELTEGEKAARREQQLNFDKARKTLYSLPNSLDKTEKINQMDKQILENNSYSFYDKQIVFIGDSITEGITASVDQNGNRVSYVTFVNTYLHFARILNHGIGGRMFTNYAGEEFSLDANFSNVINNSADIIVVFAGVNDYLTVQENKRFGDITQVESTAGYCGAVRSFMKQLKLYFGDKDIFFVTMYPINRTVENTYSDTTKDLTLNDYMEVQRKLAKEYGFNIIELYNIGFMDCSTKESSDFFLRDGLHPKDNGNIFLGEHIAAELSLYFSQKEQ